MTPRSRPSSTRSWPDALAREPVAYITGTKWGFRRLDLAVDRRVLIPRPETELLVEVGLSRPTGVRVADVGCGSGAVALALKDERPDLLVTGIDASDGAGGGVAGERGAPGTRCHLRARQFARGAVWVRRGAREPPVRGKSTAEAGARDRELLRSRPRALYAGPDGLGPDPPTAGTTVADDSQAGLLALEIGFDQADTVSSLVTAAGFSDVSRLPDLAGIERVVVGRR